MSDQEGGAEKFALTIVGLLVAIVVGSVVALGAHRARAPATPPTAAQAQAQAQGAVEQLFFGIGDTRLPDNANDVLERVTTAASADAGAVVRVSGFHDASGDAARNEALARERAQVVLHALEANGVPRGRIVLDKPAATTGGADPAQARRVDISVR